MASLSTLGRRGTLRTSGSNLTVESDDGIPAGFGPAILGMRPGVTIALSAVDRRRLEAIVGDRNAPQKHAWRAEIVLLSAPTASARSRSCAGRASRRPASGAGRSASRRKGSTASCATRPARRACRRSARRSSTGSWPLTADRAAARGDPLDRRRHGRRRPASASPRCSASGGPMAWHRTGCAASSSPTIPSSCRAQGHRWPLCRSAGPCSGAVGRREVRHVWMAPGLQAKS